MNMLELSPMAQQHFADTIYLLDEDLLSSQKLVDLCKNRRPCIVIDSFLVEKFGEKLKLHLNAELISISGGESCKTRQMKEKLEDELIQRKFNRDTLLIAVGGGALTDLVGFLASTYMRGVPLILIPTTLLGMVDASIGGKNGVNTKAGKNLIGTVYHPAAVCIDLQLLRTLPQREWQNGLAEILKHGLIYDPEIWHLCEKTPLIQQSPSVLLQLIQASISAKTEIANQDPNETGVRRILNFGHTVAHALEQISEYQMPHGEAVAIGCLAESWLSAHLGHLSQSNLERIFSLFHTCNYRFHLPCHFSKETFIEALGRDKKAHLGKSRFVILETIGRTASFNGEFCTLIANDDLNALIAWMERAPNITV